MRTPTKADILRDLVDEGIEVHWANDGYTVVKDKIGQYLIGYAIGNPHREHWIGLTWTDGETLNGKPEDFYAVIPRRRIDILERAGMNRHCRYCDMTVVLMDDDDHHCTIWNWKEGMP